MPSQTISMTPSVLQHLLVLTLSFSPLTQATTYTEGISTGVHVYLPDYYYSIRIAHAALAISAWLILFPLGGMLIRVLPRPHNLRITAHPVVQVLGYVVFVAAAGLGIWMARGGHILSGYHPIIGLVLLSVMTMQLMIGTRNQYVQYHSQRGATILHVPLGTFHTWLGRALITAGIVNGGLGFAWSASSGMAPRIAYGVVAAVVGVGYVCVNFGWVQWRKTRVRQHEERGVDGEMELGMDGSRE